LEPINFADDFNESNDPRDRESRCKCRRLINSSIKAVEITQTQNSNLPEEFHVSSPERCWCVGDGYLCPTDRLLTRVDIDAQEWDTKLATD
jgi:hypothetical protein